MNFKTHSPGDFRSPGEYLKVTRPEIHNKMNIMCLEYEKLNIYLQYVQKTDKYGHEQSGLI